MPNIQSLAVTAAVLAMASFVLVMPSKAAPSDFSNPAFAPVTGSTSIPVGHLEFCRTHRDECGVNRNVVDEVALDDRNWAQLVAVNNEVNADVVPETDEAQYHVAEYWTYPDGAGDCEDIALQKRKELIADGWPVSALLMTVVKQADGEGHALLMVRTDRGDLVLDNQDGRVLVWNQTPYQFLKRQSQANAGQWVGIRDNRAMTIASR